MKKLIKIVLGIAVGIFILLIIAVNLLHNYIDNNRDKFDQPVETQNQKIKTSIPIPVAERSESFYIQNDENNQLKNINYSFSITEIHGKYVVILDTPISTNDEISTQVFIHTAMTKYKNIVEYNKNEKNPSNVLEFVSLDTPKNQIPKPSGKSVGSIKVNDQVYYFSNLLPSNDGQIKGFTFWEENIK